MERVVQRVLDGLVQLMAPFGWAVSLESEPRERRVTFDFRLVVTAEASKVKGKLIGMRQVYTHMDLALLPPDAVGRLPIDLSQFVMRAAFREIVKALPAG